MKHTNEIARPIRPRALQHEDERLLLIETASAALELLRLLRTQPQIEQAYGRLIEVVDVQLVSAISAEPAA